MKKTVSLTSFENKHHMKSDGKGGDYSGPTIKKILHSETKLLELEQHVGDNFKPFIELLRSLANVHTLCSSSKLNPDFEMILNEFTINMEECYKKFQLSKPLTTHIISHIIRTAIKSKIGANHIKSWIIS